MKTNCLPIWDGRQISFSIGRQPTTQVHSIRALQLLNFSEQYSVVNRCVEVVDGLVRLVNEASLPQNFVVHEETI